MSTDESDQDDLLDPDTDDEENIPVASRQKPWIKRRPLYRSDIVFLTVSSSMYCYLLINQVNRATMHLDELHQAKVKAAAKLKDAKIGSFPHAVTLGHPKERCLPNPVRKYGIILITAIDVDWLARHADEVRPSQMRYEANGMLLNDLCGVLNTFLYRYMSDLENTEVRKAEGKEEEVEEDDDDQDRKFDFY